MTDAWVIGGTSGIGKDTALYLQGEGLRVKATGPEVDVRDERALRECYFDQGLPPYVVYSAGINALSFNKDLDLDIARDLFDVNVFGFMRVVKIMASNPSRRAFRSIVAVSSDAARRPMRTSMAYCASKAALDMCVKQAAREHAFNGSNGGIRVNAVAPGMTAPTGMSDYIDATVPEIRGWTPEEARKYEASQNPYGDYRIHTEEIASAIAYMLIHGPYSLTGAILEVNCGR